MVQHFSSFCGFLSTVSKNRRYQIGGDHDHPWTVDPSGADPITYDRVVGTQEPNATPLLSNAIDRKAGTSGAGKCDLTYKWTTNVPTTVTIEAEPGSNPLVVGSLTLRKPDYWTIDNIDFTVPVLDGQAYGCDPAGEVPPPEGLQCPAHEPTGYQDPELGWDNFRDQGVLTVLGGSRWVLKNSELFFPEGDNQGGESLLNLGPLTNFTYWNVNFQVVGNWFHDNPGCIYSGFNAKYGAPWCNQGNGGVMDFKNGHAVYWTSSPTVNTGALINGNLFSNFPQGSVLKVASGVRKATISQNTFYTADTKRVVDENDAPYPRSGYSGYPIDLNSQTSFSNIHSNVFFEKPWADNPAATFLRLNYSIPINGAVNGGNEFHDNVVSNAAAHGFHGLINNSDGVDPIGYPGCARPGAVVPPGTSPPDPDPYEYYQWPVHKVGFQCVPYNLLGATVLRMGVDPATGAQAPNYLDATYESQLSGLTYRYGMCASFAPPAGQLAGAQGADFNALDCPVGS